MATLEDEIKDLKEKNTELAQKVQYWKMTAAQRDDEKLALMKEINELRLKLSRLRNNGGFQARKLDAALQAASEKAISHLVKASAEIAKSMEIAKAYMRDRQELDAQSPRWSSIGGTPTTERSDRVHRVPPMMMGGQSIQPVVALSRTMLNTSNPRITSRSSNQNQNLTERAVPMHMLQDVYIPLTRIDISELPNNNMETDAEPNDAENSVEDLRLEDDADGTDESDANMSEDDHDYETGRKLHVVSEEENEVAEMEPVRLRLSVDPLLDQLPRPSKTKLSGSQRASPRNSQRDSLRENPLEGPSWLLDDTPPDSVGSAPSGRVTLEPDSTTELDDNKRKTPDTLIQKTETKVETGEEGARAFSPTVRRRRRTSSPPVIASPRVAPYSPRPASCRRNSTSGRVLKVMVAKMRLDGSEGECSPPKRTRDPTVFDAPSPNGATDSRVIVSETRTLPLDQETMSESVATTIRRESRDSEQRAPANEDGGDTQQRRRLSQEHEQGRTSSEHDLRRANNQDVWESQHRGRASSQERRGCAGHTSHASHASLASRDSRESDSGSGGAGDSISEGRTRRTRKAVTYKEKPLNRKMRR